MDKDDPRTCTECGQDLFPNYMEGCWDHFAVGCKFTGMQTGWPTAKVQFAGALRSELTQKENSIGRK
jgi:hypothetical protein